jgi:hypothetical protein
MATKHRIYPTPFANVYPSENGSSASGGSGHPHLLAGRYCEPCIDVAGRVAQSARCMNNPPLDDATFLKDLVKTSRQRAAFVNWVDRDGSARVTVLTGAESARLEKISREHRISKSDVLRQAAHVPVKN